MRRKFGELTLQQFGLCNWSTRFVQASEKFVRLRKRERLRIGSALERFQGGLSGVTVGSGDAS